MIIIRNLIQPIYLSTLYQSNLRLPNYNNLLRVLSSKRFKMCKFFDTNMMNTTESCYWRNHRFSNLTYFVHTIWTYV